MEHRKHCMVLDEDALLDRVGGDPEFLNEIAQIFVESKQSLLDQIREALCRGDAPALARAAHTIKGCVGNLGAGSAFEVAHDLEKLARGGALADAARASEVLESEVVRFELALVNLAAGLTAA
ncbi:MAG: Hpt domain-containing protein [Acidobacteriota bacterium]